MQPRCLEVGQSLSHWSPGGAALAATGFPGAVTSRAEHSLRFPWVTVGRIYSLLG